MIEDERRWKREKTEEEGKKRSGFTMVLWISLIVLGLEYGGQLRKISKFHTDLLRKSFWTRLKVRCDCQG